MGDSAMSSDHANTHKTRIIHAAILAALCIAAYAGTIHYPMLWDERAFLLDNPALKDAYAYLSPSSLSGSPMYPLLARRYVGMLSFALNWMSGGADVAGYHLVNMAVHLASTLLVYASTLLLLGSPAMRDDWDDDALKGRAALLAALLFGLHPVQTEAVTYIFQRFASMTAMFCLASLALYMASAKTRRWRAALYLASLVALALAMKTKENAFAFPLIIAMLDLALLDGSARQRALRLAPLLAAMFIVPYGVYWQSGSAVGATHYGAMEYASAQPLVIAKYLGLFLLPVGQSLEHDVSTYGSAFDPMVLGPMVLHIALAASALYMIRRAGAWRMAGLGLIWFYVALMVESSFVPIPMLMDEYRMYLPIAGLCIGLAPLTVKGIGSLGGRTRQGAYAVAFIVVPAALLTATVARNNVWSSGIALWGDVVAKSPANLRAYNNLGNEYWRAGLREEAIRAYESGIRAGSSGRAPLHLSELHYNLALEYADMGRIDEAALHYGEAAAINPGNSDALNNLGIIHMDRGELELAESYLLKAIAASNSNLAARFNLGETYVMRYEQSGDVELLRRAYPLIMAYAEAYPDYAPAMKHLEMIRLKAGL